MKHPGIYSLFLLAFLSLCRHTLAQDGHYWSQHYGNQSTLLLGTVNASVQDLGAVFYNPGRLGMVDNPAFVINARVYEWRRLTVEDGINEDVDLKQNQFGGAPSLAAGTFELPFLEGHSFAYSFLTRQNTQADFFIRVEDEGDVVEQIPGEEIFNGRLEYHSQFNDEWIGLTWSPPSDGRLGVGISGFVSSMRASKDLSLDLHALDENDRVSNHRSDRRYSYQSYGLIWKAGMALDLTWLRMGLTVTTPRIQLTGKGSTLMEDYLINVDTTGNGAFDDGYIYNSQDDIRSNARSPMAIGFGLGIPFRKGTVHISAEWYSKVPGHTVMEAAPFVGQSTQDSIQFKLLDQLNAVTNVGAGIEWHFSEKVAAFGSIASDFSAVTEDITRFTARREEANRSTFGTDFVQLGGGVSISTKAVEITVGATYNGASQTIGRTIDFPEEGEEQAVDQISKLRFSRWRFILGFSFPFASRLADKLGGSDGDQ